MVQLKVKMLLCDTGNKRQKSKYTSSLDDRVLSYDLAHSLYGSASPHRDEKIKCPWITAVFCYGSAGWWRITIVLTAYTVLWHSADQPDLICNLHNHSPAITLEFFFLSLSLSLSFHPRTKPLDLICLKMYWLLPGVLWERIKPNTAQQGLFRRGCHFLSLQVGSPGQLGIKKACQLYLIKMKRKKTHFNISNQQESNESCWFLELRHSRAYLELICFINIQRT